MRALLDPSQEVDLEALVSLQDGQVEVWVSGSCLATCVLARPP